MSELLMECEEEELEPWQKQVAEGKLLKVDEDDDDEPIFVGELTNNQKNCKTTPVQNSIAGGHAQSFHLQPSRGFTQSAASNILAGKAGNIATCLTTITQQPIIVNNQGYIVTTPQLQNNSGFFTSLGKSYPPGTSFTIIPAGQQHILQQVTPAKSVPGVVHRPQVQQIHNNVVTLSNVQSPASFTQAPKQLQQNTSNSQPVQIVSTPVKIQDNIPMKRSLPQLQNEGLAKKAKSDKGSSDVIDLVEKRNLRKMCPKCRAEFFSQETMKSHMRSCCPNLIEYVLPSTPNVSPPKVTSLTVNKRIMLVKDFYYGKYEGEKEKQQDRKTGTTFKCQSCLKVLKNNVRFMNHMKHHLELEKQNCESWESHTTCQHCYRQYSTPFQLQCHIESAHSPFESTTNCKICELAFESEQVLLEHMKDNHKPGEMPYICLVCNYRSSFFSDVETHFRNVHQNTKDLLCPFCLKVLKSGYTFMQHYMKHQNKGIHRCGKCRLNFLTYKERVEHKAQFHKTFRKPKALEGLPPGTKVTIRASLSLQSPSSPNSHEKSSVSFISETATLARKKSNSAKMKSPMNSSMGKATSKKQDRLSARNNQALRNLSIDGHYTCIECDTKIDDFFGHFPTIANCGACKYRTSCSISFGNHMIRFHSTISKDRFRRMENRKIPHVLKSLSLVCLNCDLLLDASECDRMSKHLTERPHHICKVLHDKEGFQTANKGVCASFIQQMKKTEGVDELRCELEESLKVSEMCPKSTTEGWKSMIETQSERLDSGGYTILDSKTTAHYPENASEQEFAANTLNKELPNTTLPESSVMDKLTKEQSLLPQSTSPSLSLVCSLNEVSGRSEQIHTLREYATPVTSQEPELTEILEIKDSAVSI